MNGEGCDCDRRVNFIPQFDFFAGGDVFITQYLKEYEPSLGYYDFKRVLNVLDGKVLDKSGKPIEPIQYIKGTMNVYKTGVLVAIRKRNKVLIGYSQWNRFIDDYNPDFMFNVAAERAYSLEDRAPKRIPFRIAEALPEFVKRVKRYFKDCEVVDWVKNV